MSPGFKFGPGWERAPESETWSRASSNAAEDQHRERRRTLAKLHALARQQNRIVQQEAASGFQVTSLGAELVDIDQQSFQTTYHAVQYEALEGDRSLHPSLQRAIQQSKKEAEMRALTMAKARDCVEGEFTLQSVPLHRAGPRTRVRVSLLPLTNGKQICAISFEQDAQVGPRGTRPAVTRVGEGRWSRLVSRDGADGRNVARVRVHGRWTRETQEAGTVFTTQVVTTHRLGDFDLTLELPVASDGFAQRVLASPEGKSGVLLDLAFKKVSVHGVLLATRCYTGRTAWGSAVPHTMGM